MSGEIREYDAKHNDWIMTSFKGMKRQQYQIALAEIKQGKKLHTCAI
jgi:hypothetical protein